MAVTQGTLLVVFLLIFPGFQSSPPLFICPESCTCQSDSLLNCSSAGLTSPPQHLSNSITELDLSNNQLGFLTLRSKYYDLQKVWLGNNSIMHLSLCVDSGVGIKSVNRLRRGLRPLKKWGCVLWAPTLQLLSVERNQLEELPEGLGQQRSLQTLRLSFNKISTLNPKELSHLKQLKELHLQHNLITSLDPQIFQKLDKLKVLDLSFNMLTILHPLTYVSLRDIGANVGMIGNRWTCDCKMRFLQRWMAYDSSRGLKTWSLVCALPSVYSGRDLLQLNEDDLECNNSVTNPEIHQDITVYRGSDLLLTCFEQDASWWMPDGQVSRGQQQADLLISEITDQDAGLYVCVSESQHQVVSIYNLQIRETTKRQTRNTRSLPNQQINTLDSFTRLAQPVTQSDFDMAVSLSVIITFLIAFIIGVLARPCICALWAKAKNKRNSSGATPVSTETSQRQYNNEAFEDLEDIEPYRERRVTFSTIEYSKEGNVNYYDTVAAEVLDGNVAVMGRGPGQANKESSDDSGSEHPNSEIPQNVITNAGFTHSMKFEHIPDSIKEGERNSLSSQSSHSSKEDKIVKKNCSTPNTIQAFENHVQQTAVMPQTSIEVPGFKSEPFADWSPHLNNSRLNNLDLENGELFDFSDSVQSTSPRSPSSLNGSFKHPNLLVPASNKVSYSSSSSSDLSDDEPTHYTVNPDPDKEYVETEVYNRDATSSDNDSESLNTVESHWPVLDLEHISCLKRRLDFKNIYVDSFSNKIIGKNEMRGPEQFLLATDQKQPQIKKRRAPPPPPPRKSSSSSNSDDEREKELKHTQITKQDPKSELFYQEPHSPVINLEHVSKVKRVLDIKVQCPHESSSSSDSDDKRTIQPIKQYQENMHLPKSPNKELTTVHFNQDSQWPAIKLEGVGKVKRRLDIKALAPESDSSSSDSEVERTYQEVTQVQDRAPRASNSKQESTTVLTPENVDANPPKPESDTSFSSESEDETEGYTEKQDLKTSWPVLDLAKTSRIKRRLDIKERSLPTKSLSSSDREDEREIKEVKQYQENLQQATSPVKQPTGVLLDQESQWPVIDLVKVAKVKRRLDIKAPLPPAASSSSSDSEVEKLNLKVTQMQERIPKPKSQTSSSSESEDETPHYTEKLDLKTNWPVLDLKLTSKIKRRLDIKMRSPPPPESSSSSDSEDEREIKEVKQYQENLQQATSPVKQPTGVLLVQESQWPVIDLVKVAKVKRRLDIKAPLPPAASSSSSDTEDERANLKVTQVQERLPSANINVAKPKSQTSSSSESEDETPRYTEKHDLKTPWQAVDLELTKKVKRRLDIKVRSLPSESSSSDSEDEKDIKEVKLQQATFPNKQSTTVTFHEESQWPAIDLAKVPKVKRLDIKAPLPPAASSSSSDSEVEKLNLKVTQMQERIPKPKSQTSSSSESEDETPCYTEKHDLETNWPVLDLKFTSKIKRRLDIKMRSPPPPESSSSSDSEDEREIKEVKQYQENLQQATSPVKQSTGVHLEQESQWPVIDLVKVAKVKRRLDIKAPLPPAASSSSSDSEDETQHYTNKLEQVKMDVDRSPIIATRWPVIDLYQSVQIKRRLDFKAPSPPAETSSTRDSGDETIHYTGITGLGSQVGSNEHWPIVDLGGITQLKRRLDFKTSSPLAESLTSGGFSHTSEIKVKDKKVSSSSSDEEEEVVTELHPQVSAVPQWPELGRISVSVPRISRRLDIKGPSLKSEPVLSSTTLGSQHSESSSSSEDENKKDKANLGIGTSVKSTDSMLSFPQSPATSQNITLEKYTVVTDEFRGSGTNSTTPEITTELQSKWATMNLGVSRFRKRLDIMTRTNEPPSLPSSPPPDSPTSHRAIQSKQDVLATGTQYTKSANVLETVAVTPLQLESSSRSERDFKSLAVNPDSTWPQISIPQVKRSLNITAKFQSESSASSSEDESFELTAPDLSAGVPRLKRRLNFKAPTPPPSSASSSSEDESRFVHKFTDVTDQHSIEYKRTIIKASPNDSYSSSDVKSQWQTYREPQIVESGSHTPRKIPGLNFDNIKRKFLHSKQSLDGELPPNLRWTSVGSHLSEVPTPTLKRHHDGHLSPPPTSPPPVPKDASFDSSGSERKEKLQEGKTTILVTDKSSSHSPGRVTFSSDKVLVGSYESPKGIDKILSATSQNKKGRGLSAIKAMSSERKHWDTEYENFNETPPVNVDYTPQVNTVYQRSVDLKAKPQTYVSSASSDERRLADMLYGIPSYRRHIIKTTELPQGPPPPVPSTLPPDEAAELTWRSPQSTMKQSKESIGFYMKQKNSKEEPPQDEPYLDSPNISAV